MKNLVLLCSLIALVSCNENNGDSDSINKTPISIKVVEYDSCQYLIGDETLGYAGYGYFAHKGNCTNPIHCYNK